MSDIKRLQFLFDNDHENIAIYLDNKVVIDYDDYVNFETAIYMMRALDIEFEIEFYSFSSDTIEDWDGFPQDLQDIIDNLKLEDNTAFV